MISTFLFVVLAMSYLQSNTGNQVRGDDAFKAFQSGAPSNLEGNQVICSSVDAENKVSSLHGMLGAVTDELDIKDTLIHCHRKMPIGAKHQGHGFDRQTIERMVRQLKARMASLDHPKPVTIEIDSHISDKPQVLQHIDAALKSTLLENGIEVLERSTGFQHFEAIEREPCRVNPSALGIYLTKIKEGASSEYVSIWCPNGQWERI